MKAPKRITFYQTEQAKMKKLAKALKRIADYIDGCIWVTQRHARLMHPRYTQG